MRQYWVRGGLWALAHLELRRLLKFVVLVIRSESANQVELLALRHETSGGASLPPARRSRLPDGAESPPAPLLVVLLLGEAGDAARLAPSARGPHAVSHLECQCPRRAVRENGQGGVPRPPLDRKWAPSGAGSSQLCATLQPPSSSPRHLPGDPRSTTIDPHSRPSLCEEHRQHRRHLQGVSRRDRLGGPIHEYELVARHQDRVFGPYAFSAPTAKEAGTGSSS